MVANRRINPLISLKRLSGKNQRDGFSGMCFDLNGLSLERRTQIVSYISNTYKNVIFYLEREGMYGTEYVGDWVSFDF